MTDPAAPQVIIVAEPEQALVELCGISLLERQLRILQRLSVSHATIVSASPDAIRQHLAPPSWARAGLAVRVLDAADRVVTADDIRTLCPPGESQILVIDGGTYFDARLLAKLLRHERAALLVDSAPPAYLQPLTKNAARVAHNWICGAAALPASLLPDGKKLRAVFERLGESGAVDLIDADAQPTYLPDMRRNTRPFWFPAPRPEHEKLAEHLLLDAAQNGTLDLPAIAHAPFETGIIRRLCRTRITPMQITLFTAAVSSVVTVLFASGYLLAGVWLALIVGVLDGLDGKQARVKVETTELGKREHVLDYVLELSWWIALAYHFASTGALPHAYALALLLVGSDLVDRYAKRIAKQHTGRNLDDVAPVDRFVRLIGGRRNIYIWMFAIGLAAGAADKAFAFFCYWGAGTAAVHMLRAFWIARQRRAV